MQINQKHLGALKWCADHCLSCQTPEIRASPKASASCNPMRARTVNRPAKLSTASSPMEKEKKLAEVGFQNHFKSKGKSSRGLDVEIWRKSSAPQRVLMSGVERQFQEVPGVEGWSSVDVRCR